MITHCQVSIYVQSFSQKSQAIRVKSSQSRRQNHSRKRNRNAIPQQFNYTITHTSYHIIQLKKFKINHFLYNKKYNVCTSDELKLYLKLSDVMLLHWYIMVHSFGLAFGAPPFYCLLFEIESLWLSACSVEYIERLK